MVSLHLKESLMSKQGKQQRVVAAAEQFLVAHHILAIHPSNDATKRFDRKLMKVELAENELRAALKEATGIDPLEDFVEEPE